MKRKTPNVLEALPSAAGEPLVGPLFAKVHDARSSPELAELLRHAVRMAPRIVCPDYVPGLYSLAQVPWLRPLADHRPRGKGRDALFRGIASHLLAAYPTPVFLYNAFFEDDAPSLSRVVAAVARGASLFSQCQSGALPVQLTRRMCHTVMAAPSRTRLMTAIRSAQILAEGGNLALLDAWMRTEPGRRLQTPELERFWAGVLRWLARNPVPFAIVGPLVDYVDVRRGHEADFSMKRRSVPALLRAMAEWHAQLALTQGPDERHFSPSGFRAGCFDRSVRQKSGLFLERVWTVNEILSAVALAEEGSHMRHCVYAYSHSVESGRTSIWSMRLQEGGATYRAVTIEVRNAERRIVQARGRHNRMISPIELSILVAWAGQNGLDVRL